MPCFPIDSAVGAKFAKCPFLCTFIKNIQKLVIILSSKQINPVHIYLLYCPEVLDSKCVNFVLCSRKLSSKARSKDREKFRGI